MFNQIQFNATIHFQETLWRYALLCSIEGCKHPVLGSSLGSICGCLNTAWLQQHCGGMGLDNILCVGKPWSCTVCMEARTGLTDHCGITAVKHLEDTLIWLMDLLYNYGSVNTPADELELCDEAFVFNQLCNPHSRVDQGLIMSGWRMAKVDTDKCQCTLELATGQIDLSAKPKIISQPMVQDIPKEAPKRSLW